MKLEELTIKKIQLEKQIMFTINIINYAGENNEKYPNYRPIKFCSMFSPKYDRIFDEFISDLNIKNSIKLFELLIQFEECMLNIAKLDSENKKLYFIRKDILREISALFKNAYTQPIAIKKNTLK